MMNIFYLSLPFVQTEYVITPVVLIPGNYAAHFFIALKIHANRQVIITPEAITSAKHWVGMSSKGIE
jgi:hypothetical protein